MMKMKRILVLASVCATFLVGATSTRAQDQLSDTAMKLRRQLGEQFQVNVARVEGQSLQVALNDRGISDDLYQRLVIATCTHLGADAEQFTDFAFANRFAWQGYTFKAPAKCAEIVKMPADGQKTAIMADTEPL